jgi:hypothetical protein
MCGGEDGGVSLVVVGANRMVHVLDMRTISDGAVKKLLLLRCRLLSSSSNTHEIDVLVICLNQRCVTVTISISERSSLSLSRSLCCRFSHTAKFMSVSGDVILDVCRPCSACSVQLGGHAGDDELSISRTTPVLVVVGGWGLQALNL